MLVRIIARRAVPASAGGVEQRPPVGETPFRPRSPAIKPIFSAVLGAWSGHAKPDLRPPDHPEGSWDIREASGGWCAWGARGADIGCACVRAARVSGHPLPRVGAPVAQVGHMFRAKKATSMDVSGEPATTPPTPARFCVYRAVIPAPCIDRRSICPLAPAEHHRPILGL